MKAAQRSVVFVLLCCLMAPAVQASDFSDDFCLGELFHEFISWIRATILLDNPPSMGGHTVPTGLTGSGEQMAGHTVPTG